MPTASPLAVTCITEQSHARFAALSGDLNPIHADSLAAALMEPGALLAYGMDIVLWAMESLVAERQFPSSAARLRARFVKWVYLQDEVSLCAGQVMREGLQAFELSVKDAPVATLEIFSGERQRSDETDRQTSDPVRRVRPREISLEQMQSIEGVAALADPPEAASMYPVLARTLGASAITELAACSYVIGMEAPGLYSMSMRYDLQLTGTPLDAQSKGLHYKVVAVDDRFRKAKIAVTGTHIQGTLEAFVRPA